MASAIPEDVLEHILVRLPVKSLLRCRCVCKACHSLISSPVFVSDHRNHVAGCGDTSTFVFRRCGPGPRRLRYTLHSDDEYSTEVAEFPSPFPSPTPSRIIGSVNGLICFLLDSSSLSFILWNPAIRKSLIIPANCNCNDPVAELSPLVFGFGFDPLADDYKIVRVGYGTTGGCWVAVYSLSAGSWCRSTADGFGEESRLYPQQAYLNGVVHWLAEDSTIVGFDLRSETFRGMNAPGGMYGRKMEDVGIAAWRCQLALLEVESSSRSIGVWAMEDYGDSGSWSRLCAITAASIPSRVKGIASNGRMLVEDTLGLLFWFDPLTRRTAELGILDVGDVDMFHVKPYAHTLVLLNNVLL